RRIHVPAQAVGQGEARCELPGVLAIQRKVAGDEGVALIVVARGGLRDPGKGSSGSRGDTRELDKLTVGVGMSFGRKLPVIPAKFHLMSADGDGQVIHEIELGVLISLRAARI